MSAFVASMAASAQELAVDCGTIENAYGPYDYANASDHATKLEIVERYHFTPKVENLTAGQSGPIPMDLDYTLRAFPNHARALWAMARYQLKTPHASNDQFYTIECYFDRALRWRPDDPAVWSIYGLYLARKGEQKAAVDKYERALRLAPDSPEINYNAGLAFFELKQYGRSLELARKAYAGGYPLPGLKNMLSRVGEWKVDTNDSPPSKKN